MGLSRRTVLTGAAGATSVMALGVRPLAAAGLEIRFNISLQTGEFSDGTTRVVSEFQLVDEAGTVYTIGDESYDAEFNTYRFTLPAAGWYNIQVPIQESHPYLQVIVLDEEEHLHEDWVYWDESPSCWFWANDSIGTWVTVLMQDEEAANLQPLPEEEVPVEEEPAGGDTAPREFTIELTADMWRDLRLDLVSPDPPAAGRGRIVVLNVWATKFDDDSPVPLAQVLYNAYRPQLWTAPVGAQPQQMTPALAGDPGNPDQGYIGIEVYEDCLYGDYGIQGVVIDPETGERRPEFFDVIWGDIRFRDGKPWAMTFTHSVAQGDGYYYTFVVPPEPPICFFMVINR